MKPLNDNPSLLRNFYDAYDFALKTATWAEYSRTFRDIWKNKISKGRGLQSDFDSIVFLIDSNARGRTKNDEVVAKTYIRYGTWYRAFGDLNTKPQLRTLMDEIFSETESDRLTLLLNKIEKENADNKNGLTGANGVVLNSLLFLNNPELFVCSVSLAHRRDIMTYLGLGKVTDLDKMSFGEKLVHTNNVILDAFKTYLADQKLSVAPFILPRFISEFIYFSPLYGAIWKRISEQPIPDTGEENDLEKQNFYLEKYLENFLYTNWDSTDLGKRYDIIEEEGEPVSLQYRTDIGIIDLLVKDKKSGDYLIIELKRAQTSDDTIGQVTRYMGWVKTHLAGNKGVKGLIIAESFDEKIKYSLQMVKDIEFMSYSIQFTLKPET